MALTQPTCLQTHGYAQQFQVDFSASLVTVTTSKGHRGGNSLAVQWLRLCHPNPGGQVQSLVRDLDPTARGLRATVKRSCKLQLNK